MHDVDELSPEVAARVDALLATVDLDPLARAVANAIWDAWEREVAALDAHNAACQMCSIGERCLDGRLLENRARRVKKGASAS